MDDRTITVLLVVAIGWLLAMLTTSFMKGNTK